MKKNQVALTLTAASLALLVTSGCATGPDRHPGDPFEPANRAIFTFNDKLDTYFAQPIAKGYQKVTPQPLRQAITNFFSNIGDVGNLANNLLQLKITDATEDLMRIAMNTVFGLGGLIDFATPAGLPKHHQDFGLTMGHYGVPAGPYLVLPLFGPSTVRDGVGIVGNYFINPLTYVQPDSVSWALYGLNLINTRANLLNASDVLEGAALDKYSFVRNAYLQRRRYLLTGGNASSSSLPDYGSEAPLPKYEDVDGGAAATPAPASAPVPASAAAPAPASAPEAASGATSTGVAGAAQPASGTEAPPTVPAGQIVPPALFGYPSLKLR